MQRGAQRGQVPGGSRCDAGRRARLKRISLVSFLACAGALGAQKELLKQRRAAKAELSCHRKSVLCSRSLWLQSPIWVSSGHSATHCWPLPLSVLPPSDPRTPVICSAPHLGLRSPEDRPMYCFSLRSNIYFSITCEAGTRSSQLSVK